MRKTRFKLLCSIMVLALVVISSFSNVSFAQRNIDSTVSEYEYLKDLNKKLMTQQNFNQEFKEMMGQDLTNEDIEFIRDYKTNYINHIYNLKSLDIQVLENMNYTNDQIDAIKNFDGSEDMLERASARLSFRVNSPSGPSGTKITIRVVFTWYGNPVRAFTDIIGVGWLGSYTSNGTIKLKYKSPTTGYDRYSDVKMLHEGSNGGSFKIKHTSSGSSLQSGEGSINLTGKSTIKSILVTGAYGKTSLVGTPSVSITPGQASIGISFGAITKTFATDQHSIGYN